MAAAVTFALVGADFFAAAAEAFAFIFAAAGVLHCRFEVYGAARDAKTGQPDVLAGFSIRRSDGRFLAAAAETPLKPAPDGSLTRSFGTRIDGAPAGRYEMIVLVTDQAAGKVAEIREPFSIERAPIDPGQKQD